MEAAFELMLPYQIHVLIKCGGRIACIVSFVIGIHNGELSEKINPNW